MSVVGDRSYQLREIGSEKDAVGQGQRRALARWYLGAGIVATISADPGARTRARPGRRPGQRLARPGLAGAFELLMPSSAHSLRARSSRRIQPRHEAAAEYSPGTTGTPAAPPLALGAPSLEHTVRAWHQAGRSQRAIARELSIDCRKVKYIIDQTA
jgi:hypothetical protein